MLLTSIFGTLGTILSFCLQISPIPSIISGFKAGEIKSITLPYFVIANIASIQWICFGIGIKDLFVILVNSIGFTLFIIYMNMYIYIKYNFLVFFLIHYGFLVEFSLSYFFLSKDVSLFLAVIIASVWQSATIPTMRLALQNKDSSYIDILLNFISFTNFVVWLVYSILIHTNMMVAQNAICSLFCFMNIYIYFWSTEKIDHNNWIISVFKLVLFVPEKEKDIYFEKDSTSYDSEKTTIEKEK